mgnify:FL=1
MIKSKENDIGARAFLIGVVLAIIIGIASSTLIRIQVIADYNDAIYAILIILGIIVGFMNVTGKDSQTFMIAGAILVIVSRFGMESISGSLIGIGISEIFSSVFRALLVLFVPATIIVALKTVFSIARV